MAHASRTTISRLVPAGLAAVGLAAVAVLGAGTVAQPWLIERAGDRMAAALGHPVRLTGRLGFTASPDWSLLLHDVEARIDLEPRKDLEARKDLEPGAVATVTAERVALGGSPWALLTGAAPRDVVLDGVVARLPSRWWRRREPVAADPGSPSPETVLAGLPARIVVRGGAVHLVGADGRVEASLDAIALALLESGDRTHALDLSLRLGSAPVLADLRLGPATGSAIPVTGRVQSRLLPFGPVTWTGEARAGEARTGAAGVDVPRLSGRFGDQPFTGAASLSFAGKPVLRAELRAPRLVWMPDAAPPDIVRPDAVRPDAARPDNRPRDPAADIAANVAALNFLDADLGLVADEVRIGPLAVTGLAARARVADGTATASLVQAGLYGGTASGSVALAAQAGIVQRAVAGEIRGARLLPFLSDAAGLTGADGLVSLRLDLRGAGAGAPSRETGQVAIGLDTLRLSPGALPDTMRGLVASMPALKPDDSGRIPVFDRMEARFQVGEGRATSDDITARGALLEARGSGTVDLEAGTVAFRFEPRLAAGSRLAKSLAGLDMRVPIVVDGPLLSPRVYPDLGGLVASGATLPNLGALGDLAVGAIVDALTTPPAAAPGPSRDRRPAPPPARPR